MSSGVDRHPLFPRIRGSDPGADEATRDEALRALAEARDPSLMAGLNDVLYYHYYGR